MPVRVYGLNFPHNQGGDACHGISFSELCLPCRRKKLQKLAKRSIEVADGMPGVVWIKSYISESEGKTYCEYEAPNPDVLFEHARRLGISAEQGNVD